MTRRIIYNKKFDGSPFRTLGGGTGKKPTKGKGGGSGTRPRGPQFVITVSIHPDYKPFIPGSTEWQAWQSYFIPGAATIPQWRSQIGNTAGNITTQWQSPAKTKFAEFTSFMFENTLFDSDAAIHNVDWTPPMPNVGYYAVATRAGIENPPMPNYGDFSVDGLREWLRAQGNSPELKKFAP